MLAECPECEMPMRSRACPCGYRMPAEAPPMPDYVESYAAKPVAQSFRARWFAERGLDYEAPRLVACPPFQCVGRNTPMREPGED